MAENKWVTGILGLYTLLIGGPVPPPYNLWSAAHLVDWAGTTIQSLFDHGYSFPKETVFLPCSDCATKAMCRPQYNIRHVLTPNGALVREITLFQGSLGW